MSDSRPEAKLSSLNQTQFFPDQREAEAYLKTLSPRTVKKFWKFIKSDDLRKYPSFIPYALNEINIDNIGVLSARVFVLSQKWRKGSLQAGEFRSKIQHLAGSGSIDIFEKLSVSVQQEVWTEEFDSKSYLSCVERAYLDLLRRTSFHPSFGYYHYTHSYELKMGIHEDAVERLMKLGSTLDLSESSSDFGKSLKSLFPFVGGSLNYAYTDTECLFDFGPRASSYVTLLRALYGEKKIIDAFTWIYQGGVRVCLEEVMKILDSWQEFSQYPPEWIASTHGFKHHMQYDKANKED